MVMSPQEVNPPAFHMPTILTTEEGKSQNMLIMIRTRDVGLMQTSSMAIGRANAIMVSASGDSR